MTQPVLIEHAEAVPVPDFFPPEIRSRVAGKRIRVRTHRAMIDRLRAPEDMTVREWANRYREVASVEAISGPWREEEIPHTAEIMEAISLPWVREICLCMPERAGKTQVLINAAMWQIDRGIDAGNIFWLMPTEAEAKKAFGERLIPSLQATRRTRALLSRFRDDTTLSMIRFRHGVRIFPAWSNSPATIASFFGRLNIADETDKFASRAGDETDPLTLLRKRGRDRADSKFIFASTPGQKYIYTMTMSCEQVWSRRPRCPHCGELVTLTVDCLIIPEGATEETVKNGGHAVACACPQCGAEWDDADRRNACHAGAWVAVKGGDRSRPTSVGYHAAAFAIDKIPLAEIAAAHLRAQAGDIAARVAWANGYLCEDYVEELSVGRDVDHILRYKSGLPRNAVPLGTARLGLLADTQQDHFYYELWAYGYAPEFSMHMVRHGIVQSFDDLGHILNGEEFTDADGKSHKVSIGLIDSGGGRKFWQKHSRTVEVYEFCRLNPKMKAIKGIWSGMDGGLITYKSVDTYPGTNKRIPGGIVRANIKVSYFKDELARRLAIEPDDPGALHFHDGIESDFAVHYTTEGKDANGDWIHDRKKGRNDFWDCNVYAMALLEMLKTQIGKKPAPATRSAEPPQAPQTDIPRTLPSWRR